MTLAAPGDTWGIPGTTFLLYYVVAVFAVLVLAAVHRRSLFAGSSGVTAAGLGAQQIAYLNGGNKIAVYTSLAGLRASGAVSSSPAATLVQSGPMPSGLTPLDQAIYHAAGRNYRVRDLSGDQWVAQALIQLRESLERNGLVVTTAQRSAARLWMTPMAVLVLIGIVRANAGSDNGKPITYIVLATFVAAVATYSIWKQAKTVPTRAATKAMREVRRTYKYLAPSQAPSFATYGATGAALGVALYGGMSLYAMDPAFAAEAEIQRNAAAGGYAGGSSGGTSCGAASSCSSSSSSCSSGSSCGGGGGCGGGGCGG